MLAIEQMTSGVAMAVLMSVMMFLFSPVIAGLSLVGLALGMLVLRRVRLRAAQYAPFYQEAQEHLVGKVMEYIRGISVLRSFPKARRDRRKSALRSRKNGMRTMVRKRLRLVSSVSMD